MTTVEVNQDQDKSRTIALMDKILQETPELVSELRHRYECNEKKVYERIHRRIEAIAEIADWLENNIRIGDAPCCSTYYARDVYNRANGSTTIGILEFVAGALLAGFPVTIRDLMSVDCPENGELIERVKSYFVFHFNSQDMRKENFKRAKKVKK